MDTLCATEDLSQARDAKLNSTEMKRGSKQSSLGTRRDQTGDSRRLPRRDATEVDLVGSGREKGVGRESQAMGKAQGKGTDGPYSLQPLLSVLSWSH